MPGLSFTWKKELARLVRLPVLRHLMVWGIRAVVPRHRIGVAVVALDEAERVLMLNHVFHPIAPWGVPGGWLGRNESPAQGALRELREETGLTAVLGPVVDTVYDPYPPHIGLTFLAYAQPGTITLSAEIIEANWFSIDNLPGPLLSNTHKAIHSAYQLHYTLKRSSYGSNL